MSQNKHGKKVKSKVAKHMDRPSKSEIMQRGHDKLSKFFGRIGLSI